jgi:sugar (pentulose or hexulose) kinase
VGATADHDAADFTRAAVESVAAEVRRCLVAAGGTHRGHNADGPLPFESLALGGRGSAEALWPSVLAAVCGLPATTRRSGEAASAGAALLGARGADLTVTLDELDPPAPVLDPDTDAMAAYERWRSTADVVAQALIGLDLGPGAA